ncbi:MAG: FG-GAP-like repeat-containing protein [Patescibacteria group bacterium]
MNYPAGDDPGPAIPLDVDRDGDQDLVVVNYQMDTISVLLNNGNGIFSAPVSYLTGDGPYSAVAVDVDGDGILDIATPNERVGTVSILKGNGDGTFSAKTDYTAGGTNSASIAAADLDGDGDQDLVVMNSGSLDISLLINNGSGAYSVTTTHAVSGTIPYFVIASDLDGDNDPDVVVVNASPDDSVSIFLNNGSGALAPKVDYPTAVGPTSVSAADVDGDGDVDLVTANYAANVMNVLFNNGNAVFASPIAYGTGASPLWIATADLDNDGDQDVATANYEDSLTVFENNGNGTFAAGINYAVGVNPYSVFFGDLDNDGYQDLIVANVTSEDVSILLNDAVDASPSGSPDRAPRIPNEIRASILPEICSTDEDVHLLLHAHNAKQVKISNLPDLSDAEWQEYAAGVDRAALIDWKLLEGDGKKTVYIVFKSPFDELSEIVTASVVVDRENACHTPEEHAHIVDEEGAITAPEVQPACLSDYGHATVEPYLVDATGKSLGWRDRYVRVVQLSSVETQYAFETNGDNSFDDIVVHVELLSHTANVHVDRVKESQAYDVRVRVDAADRGMIDDAAVWLHGIDATTSMRIVDLNNYSQVCESHAVPHPHPGTLFRSPTSDVYFFGSDLKRHAFPNKDVYRSWYSNGTEILTVAGYQVAEIPLGENVTLRPGVLTQIGNELRIFAVDFDRSLRPFISSSIMMMLYGPMWESLVHQMSSALVVNYVFGPTIISATDPVATPANNTASTIDVWEAVDEDHDPMTHSRNVVDGRVTFEGTPYLPIGTARDVEIRFHIFAKDGHAFTAEDLKVAHDKRLHLLVVRDDLTGFQHLHPEEKDGLWTVRAQVPNDGRYYAYVDIAPLGEPRVILREPLVIGEDPAKGASYPTPDPARASIDNPFRLELLTTDIVAGKEYPLRFRLTKDGKPFADIRRWLDAFGHLIILKQDNLNVFRHTHPSEGPLNGELEFMASFASPGRYTMFVQMDVAGTVRTFSITIDVPEASQ